MLKNLRSGREWILLIHQLPPKPTNLRVTHDGSPLLALQMIADNAKFAERISTIFIEHDEDMFPELKKRVDAFYRDHPQIREPQCLFGTFTQQVDALLSSLQGNLAPTFLFVDPCGVSGVSLRTIKSQLTRRGTWRIHIGGENPAFPDAR
jgi:three-Cys-motif partner protein